MGQYWNWYNITQMLQQKSGSYGKLGEWIFSHDLGDLRVLLGQLPDLPNPLEGKDTPSALICSTGPESRSLASLPKEVLRLIFEEIEDYFDLVLFAFSCRYLLAVAYPQMLRARREYFAYWAGDAIICLGDYTTALPDKEELESIADEFMDEYKGDEGFEFIDMRNPPSYLRTMSWFPRGDDLHHKLHKWLNLPYFRDTPGWTLRNLSTRQYVRNDAINFRGDGISIGLGQALSFRCGWSQDNSTSSHAEGLNEGRWAGDRLDIVPYDKDAKWAKEWEDVSLEVERDIRKGYIAERLLKDEDINRSISPK